MNKETITTPVVNLIDDSATYVDRCLALYRNMPEEFKGKMVQWFKHLFGRQNYCFTGVYRYHVWEKAIGNIGWRIYVRNGKGVCLEVPQECSSEEALDMANDFFSCVGP